MDAGVAVDLNAIFLDDCSQVSTGRGCDFCTKVIRDTKWYTCSQCVAIDLCLDCYRHQQTMPLVLKHQSPQCAVLSDEERLHLPQRLPGSEDVIVHKHLLQLWTYPERMANPHYHQLTKRVRKKLYKRIKRRCRLPDVKFTQRDVTILTWKLGELESDTRRKQVVEAERASIYALLGKVFSQAKLARILSLDGGGTRGYLTIRVLEEAFKHVAENFPVRLREIANDPHLDLTLVNMGDGYMCLREPAYLAAQKYFMRQFDTINGTSTGALIGFCLAVDIPLYKIRELYANAEGFFKKNFNGIRWLGSEYPLWGPKYDSNPIETKMLNILQQYCSPNGNPDQIYYQEPTRFQRLRRFFSSLFGKDPPLGEAKKIRLSDVMSKLGKGPSGQPRQLVINAFDMGHNKMINFNTKYKPHHHYGMFDILRGAMAGELYFSPHKPSLTTYANGVDTDQYLVESLYVDAGIYANDPTLVALDIARLNPKNPPSTVYVVLGIGTGVHDSTFQTDKGIGGGGLSSWIKGQSWGPKIAGGLLPNTCMEATRSFTETVASDLGRSRNFPRFKYNQLVKDAVALDDLKFKSKVDAAWPTLETSTDMESLRRFMMKHITPPPPHRLTLPPPPPAFPLLVNMQVAPIASVTPIASSIESPSESLLALSVHQSINRQLDEEQKEIEPRHRRKDEHKSNAREFLLHSEGIL